LETLRIIPLGGMGEVGRNLTVLEYGDDIIVVDCGLMFPESDMLGVDLVLPNFEYLVQNADRVRAYFITHGHEDHLGALPYILPRVNAPVYGTRLTLGLLQVKLKEHKLLESTERVEVEPGVVYEVGAFKVEPYRVSHSIPDAVGFAIDTPLGLVVHSGEYKFDMTPVDGQLTDLHRLAEYGQRGVLALLADSTNSERPGHTPSEAIVREALERVFDRASGRVIVATFASNISRIQEIVNVAGRYGRRVAVVGRSMENNVQMARSLGYLHIPDERLISIRAVDELPDTEVAIVCTGTQGEPTSALVRMANDNHRDIHLKDGDTIVLSATPIPGNEELVHRTLNNLFRHGANVIYQALTPVHVSGHANREEQKLLLRLIRPRYFVPNGGEYRMLVLHGQLALELGMPEEDILIIENGQILEFDGSSARRGGEVAGGYVYVDGLGIGDVGSVVLRDRQLLARDGFVVVVVPVSNQTGTLAGGPEVLTRGFVYSPTSTDLIQDMTDEVVAVVAEVHGDHSLLNTRIADRLGRYILERTGRRPMVLPVVVPV
jgi:ribonuclease J